MKKSSIQSKLNRTVILISLCIALVIGGTALGLLYYVSYHEMEIGAQATSDAYALLTAEAIEGYKNRVEYMAGDNAIDPALSVEELDVVRYTILDAYDDNGEYADILVVTKDGRPFDNPELDLSQRPYVVEAMAGKTYCSSPTKITPKNGWSSTAVTVSTRIKNDVGYDGVIVSYLKTDVLCDLIEQCKIGEKGMGLIVDANGGLVAHEDRELVHNLFNYFTAAEEDPAQYGAYKDVIQTAITNKSGAMKCNLPEGNMYVCYRPIEGMDGWTFISLANVDEFMVSFQTALVITIILVIVALVCAAFIGMHFSRGIAKPIMDLSVASAGIKEGNLDIAVDIDRNDEIGELADSFRYALETLKTLITDIRKISTEIADGNFTISSDCEEAYVGAYQTILTSLMGVNDKLSTALKRIDGVSNDVTAQAEQVSGSAQTLSHGTVAQASAIEEIASTISDLNERINENAQFTKDARGLSEVAEKGVRESAESMGSLNQAMLHMKSSADEIGKIIKTIDDIAFQTNILALNAAVEAARAGTAGKGFAVVADEVRSLAAKSAEAVQETTTLIENTQRAIENGFKLANETTESLNTVGERVKRVDGMIGEIATACDAQAIATQQLSSGIDQISSVVHANGATAEEFAAVSAELSRQVGEIKRLVETFDLKI